MKRLAGRDEQGSILLLVLGSLVAISLVLFATLAYAVQTSKPTRHDQDAKIAFSAAQAGIDEYVSRLTANDNYWKNGDSDSLNSAFGSGQTIQGTGTAGAKYTYHVLSTPASTAQDGLIRVQVTGTSTPGAGHDAISRTVIATLQVRGFLSYVYLSDVEVVDPSIIGGSASCANYHYATGGTPARPTSGCNEIQWTGGDTVRGPLHSNDALQINGSVNFTDTQTESSWPTLNGTASSTTWWGSQSPPLSGHSPVYAAGVSLPVSNATLLQYVSPDVDGSSSTPPGPGCYYQGASEFVFNGGSMSVRSPMTSRSDTPARCLATATRSQWQTITPIPPVIYVDSATSGSCSTGSTSAFSYPQANANYNAGTSTAVSWGDSPNYSCMRGTAYVKGQVASSLTIASADDVVVTGNLTVDSLTGANVIGLVAGNCVWVYHPVNSSGNNLLTTPVSTIQAAILSLRHSFLVENWAQGSALGTLTVTGAIAQKFRGPVGTGSGSNISTGYYKYYSYDSRLANVQPPYFLKPTSTPWKITSVVDR
ncbi:MAG TPA: hypothetical protein VHN80_24735 [Kineosporiaceae bacterium]|nr:hypothetical protein [Kineosporiaceae bacterium]